jgi:hypothetical protein
MTADFVPRLDILPPPQRRLSGELTAVPGEFVLYGGTALALHLGHRESLDFDFFGNKPLDSAELVPAVPFLVGAIVTQREPNTFSCTVDRGGEVKLSFFGFPIYRRRWSRRIMACRSPRSSTSQERRRPWCKCVLKQKTTSISMRC